MSVVVSVVVSVDMSVILSGVCWSSLWDQSSLTTVSRRVGRMFFVGSVVMDDCQSSCQSCVFGRCQVGRHGRPSFVVWVVIRWSCWPYAGSRCGIDRHGRLSVVVSVVCFSLLSGRSSWTTIFRCVGRHVGDHIGRMLVIVVVTVVMDDCLSSFVSSCR